MPQRASQRKFGKSLKLHLAKQKKQRKLMTEEMMRSTKIPVNPCEIWRMICHAQSLAATNRVTEQLSWLAVESFFMSCSISWMASLIDNLYLLDLILLVIN